MPGPVVHTIIAEQLPDNFESADESMFDLTDIANQSLRAHRRALVYGAQGPDPFFFNPDDLLFDGVAGFWMKWAELRGQISVKIYDLLEPLRKTKEKIRDDLEAGLDRMEENSPILDELTDMQARFKYIGAAIGQIMKGFVKKTILDKADPFGLYISPLQTCGQTKWPPVTGDWEKDHKSWWWFDNLHSRRTGDFATELLDIATGKSVGVDGDERERPLLESYSIGYLSHMAADVVGHSYVNSITGGPYRLNQSQRHTAQEKIMDVWAYDHYYQEGVDQSLDFTLKDLNDRNDDRYYRSDELVTSGMHKNFQFTIGDIGPKEWKPDPSKTFGQGPNPPIRSALKLPDEISENFALAANRAYDTKTFGEMDPEEVGSSYRSWYKMFMSSNSEVGPVPPEELPGEPNLTGRVQEELNELKKESQDVSDAVENLVDSIFDDAVPDNLASVGKCVENLVDGDYNQSDVACANAAAKGIAAYMAQAAAAVANLAKQVMDVFSSLFQVIEAIAAIPLRALNLLLHAAYKKLWALYKNTLMLVTAIGFGSMYSDDLDNPHLKNMWDPKETDAAGRSARDWIVAPGADVTGFPRKGMKAGHTVAPEEKERLDGLENDAHLLVPFTDVEEPRTIPGPDLYGVSTPEIFINDSKSLIGIDSTYDDSNGNRSFIYDAIPNPEPNTQKLGENLDIGDYRPDSTDEAALRKYQTSDKKFGPSVALAKYDEKSAFRRPGLGDAVTLTTALFKKYQQEGTVPNLNMSGDRAIGFPTWANAAGCNDDKSRQRWSKWHGEEVPWLIEDIDPVFVPDLEEHY